MSKQEQSQVEVKVKEKKVYLADSKVDLKQMKFIDNLKRDIVKLSLKHYINEDINDKAFNKFMIHLNKKTKPNKSRNDLNYRIESIYNLIISIYSEYIDFIDFITNDNVNTNNTDSN